MKKRIILVLIIVIVLILLVPIPFYLKDGGSVEFRALLYTVTKHHKLALVEENGKSDYIEGISIKILGMEVYNNVDEQDIKNEYNNKEEHNEQNQIDTTTQEYNSFVGTVLEETTTYIIVEPNEDEVERKIADKIKINYGDTEYRDYLYGIGRKVIINYTGYIKETYPAQIDTDSILINGYEKFEITIKESKNKNTTKILNNKELNKYNTDYDLYYYGIDEVKITINNKTMLLEEALRSGKMTIDGIIIKANKDFPNAEVYKDGGSMEYNYDNYTIIKMHKEDGNRDVYIGTKDMTLNNIN